MIKNRTLFTAGLVYLRIENAWGAVCRIHSGKLSGKGSRSLVGDEQYGV